MPGTRRYVSLCVCSCGAIFNAVIVVIRLDLAACSQIILQSSGRSFLKQVNVVVGTFRLETVIRSCSIVDLTAFEKAFLEMFILENMSGGRGKR